MLLLFTSKHHCFYNLLFPSCANYCHGIFLPDSDINIFMGYGHVTNEPSPSADGGRHKNLLMLIDEKSNKAAIITINERWLGWAACQLLELI